jgi:anti-sigma-K factor RskA
MTIDDAVLIDYALGTLPANEAEEVERVLRVNPEAARQVRRMQDDLAELVLSLPPETADEASEDALVVRLRGHKDPPLSHGKVQSRPSRRSARWAAFGLAAAMGVAAWLVLGPLIRTDRLEQTVERYQSLPGSLSSRLVTEEGRDLGTLVRLEDGRLFVAFEERAAEGVFQLWQIVDGKPESLAVVEGRSFLTEPVAEGAAFALTVEPPGGSPQPTMAPLVVVPL